MMLMSQSEWGGERHVHLSKVSDYLPPCEREPNDLAGLQLRSDAQ